jgi:hypothetical protein
LSIAPIESGGERRLTVALRLKAGFADEQGVFLQVQLVHAFLGCQVLSDGRVSQQFVWAVTSGERYRALHGAAVTELVGTRLPHVS